MSPLSVVLIAAATPRSLGYLDSLRNANQIIEEVFILDECGHLPGQRDRDGSGVMALRLQEICNKYHIKTSLHPSDVNSESLVNKLKNSKSTLAIYSGYGGQIIKQNVLEIGKKILHIHTGILPEYRGSTTIYYAILNRDDCGATAILLDNNIDTGAIVGQKIFPTPEAGSDIDFRFDIKSRADFLVDFGTNSSTPYSLQR